MREAGHKGLGGPLTLLGLGLIAVAMLVHLRAWLFLCDDAFISFRYARNLARHGALDYNLGERVEGYTNLAWVLMLGLGDALGLAPEQLAAILTATASLGSLLLVALISGQLRRRFGGAPPAPAIEPVDLLGPALLVTVPEFVVWGSSGLETSAAAMLGLLAVWLWLGGRIEAAAMAAAATGMMRLDALVWIGTFGLAWLAIVGLERRRASEETAAIPWRRVAIAGALFVVPLLAAFVFRRSYYGSWLPNTWAVKHHGALLRDSYGLAYLHFWVAGLGLSWLVWLLPLLRRQHALLLAPMLAQLAWAWSIGGDFMAYGRFLLPATCLSALLVTVVLADARHRWQARRFVSAAWWLIAAALVLGSAARIPQRIAADRARAHLHLDEDAQPLGPGFESVDGMHRFAAVRVAAGAKLAERVPADTLITVGAAGALPYASMLPTYDSYGLIDAGVVAVATPRGEGGRPGHQLHAPIEYMKSHDPALMCHLGYAGEQPPPRGLDRRMGAGRDWVGWACVETGPIADRRAPGGTIPSHYYCCLRPRGRFEELDPRPGRSR